MLVNTPNSGIASVTFRIFLRPGTAGGAIHPTDNSQHVGDSWLISVSALTPAPVATPNTLTFENPGGTNSSDVSAGFAGTDSQPGTLTSLTLTTFPTNATSITINGTKYTGAAAFNAASVTARTLTTDGDGTLATGQSVAVDPLDGGRTAVLPFIVTDVQGATSAAANLNIIFTATSSGYVFEDVNYGGGAGRPFSTPGTSPRVGATVELYNTNTGAFVARTTTDATGKYSFNTLANTGYTVRVVNSTVTSSRNSNNVAGLVPVQTYNGTTDRVGGESPNLVDAVANTGGLPLASLTVPGVTTPESLATFNTNNNNGPDFGFNFDTVVNTNDVATVTGNNAQGSLRQFLLNSNALTSEAALAQVYTNATGAATALTPAVEKSIFMIPNGQAIAGQRTGLTNGFTTSATGGGTGTSATITLQAVLPNITGNFTSLDGSTQTRATGSSNAAVTTTGSESLGSEVAINFNNLNGFETSAASTSLLNLSLTNAITTGGSSMAAFRVVAGATSAVVQNNTFYKNGANLRINGVGGATISNNISRDAISAESDGIEVTGSSNNTIANNQFLNNAGFGIDFISGTSTNNTVTGNTFSRNGQNSSSGFQTAGIGLRSAGANNNTISGNTFTNNRGDGISATAGTNNVFSQNSFSDNGDLAIDLGNAGNANGDGVTLNTADATRTGANKLVNFPILTTAAISGTNLVVSGYVRPGALVELYLATPDPTGFGEGTSYLTNFTQRTTPGTTGNVVTGASATYGPAAINGLNQGTDNTNTFTVTISLSSLTAAQIATLQSGTAVLTSTATIANSGTSEFSGNTLLAADVTTALAGPATVVPGQATGTYTATFTNEGPQAALQVTRKVTLPAGATNVVIPAGATISGSVIDFGTATTLASGVSNAFTFSFTPAATATGTLSITSNVTTTTSQGTDLAPNASTIIATVTPVADVATTIVANTTPVEAGTLATATNPPKFTVTFTNNGPVAAEGVTRTVQLPTGLTGVTFTGTAGTYDSMTGVVTYTGTSLTSGNTITSGIAFNAPVNGPVVATSFISTTTNEAGNTGNNLASATINISPVFDLTTTISGPASAAPGALVTLAVTTTNNGPSAASNAVQTVQQLPQNLENVYVSNGGVYNGTNATKNFTVNGVTYSVAPGEVVFPTIGSLPSGQTVANSISFSQPASAYSPLALVSTTTGRDTNPANNTAYLNGAASSTTLAVVAPVAGIANAYTTITSSVASTTVGGSITLTVVTGNNGPSAATGVVQKVQLLPGLTGLTISNGGTYNATTGIVTFPTLTNGANGSTSGTSVSNTITFLAPASIGNNGQLLAMAAVSTTNTDPVPADNVASVGVTLLQSADLATTITGPTSALVGQSVTYTATFTNNGPMTATNVLETAQLPAGLTAGAVVITDPAGGVVTSASYDTTTGLVTFPTQPTDLNGASQVYNITFVAPSQTLVVRSNVTSSTVDAVPKNNNASVTTTMTASADLATTVAGPATAVIGSAVTYSVTTTNNGPSTATNTVTTLQLDKNLTTVSVPNGSYNSGTGLVTFNTLASQVAGTTTTNYVTFVMPNVADGQTSGVASATSDVTDPTAGNNTASVATSVAPATATSADITASVTAGAGTAAPGSTIAFTAVYGNLGTDPAVNVVPTLQLAPGFTTATIKLGTQTGTLSNGLITFATSGAVYNQQTGLVTFPTVASQAVGTASNVSYVVNVTAPANGPVVAVAATTSNTSEPNTTTAQANNVFSASVVITPSFDEVTSLSGPASAPVGGSVTYVVTTTNNGSSATSNPTTQTVTLPAGVTVTNISPGGTQTGNTITWTVPTGQAAGANGAVANSFTIVQPAGGTTVTANVTVTGESNTGNNSATITTPVTNRAPLAYAVVNTLQGPQSNDAGGLPNGLLISPLNASDPEIAFSNTPTMQKYTVVAAPNATQGTLYYNTTGTTYATVAAGQTLTDAQAQTLKFKAATGYVGNASFTYLTTDAVGNVSPIVNYTIPIETDADAPAYMKTPLKGGTNNSYGVGDIIAYVVDANGAVYNAATSLVYTGTGVLQANANNGVASAVAGAFTSSRTDVGSFAALGLTVDNNGRIVVSDPGTVAAPKLRTGSYSISITTTDVNGGVATQVVSFVIPGAPLPVVLTALTAQAVQNRDALLSWTTASEVNSAYFEVERSLDGTNYTKIGQQAAKGNSATTSNYTFTDAGIAARANGAVYYRLRQVDLDATASYSPVRTVSFTKVATVALSLYPNPAQNATTLDVSALPATGTYQVLVLDATGRTVRTVSVGGGQLQTLNLTGLASGTYQVLVTGTLANGDALRQVIRLTKE
ncbi:right-handed parallel beta-helix repeat-containing protein [Hymenobacter sp. H14-R3]|nr:right-handed parallel beta-helix repeat-containing protein [Hymenobacter sp. H14-R3]